MALPPELNLEPRPSLTEQPTQARADLLAYAGWSGSYGQGHASGTRLTYTTLTAFVWWTSPRIDDPVRVHLSEALQGIFVDARLELSFFGNIDLPLGSSYRIGDELSPGEDLYNFAVASRSESGGLVTYHGETLLSRLNRVIPDGTLVLIAGAGDVPDPLTPSIALERVLDHFGIPHGPVPDLLIRTPDGTLELHMPAFVFETRAEENANLLQLLEEFLAPFAGYRIRATAGNELDIAAPAWADPLAETLVLTQADLAPEGEATQSTEDIVNACTVTVQGFVFLEDQPIMQPVSLIVRGGSSTRRRTLGSPWSVGASTGPTDPSDGFLSILNVSLPRRTDVASHNGGNPLEWRSAVWPLADGVTSQPGQPITVDIELRVHRRTNDVDDGLQTINATAELPTDGSTVDIWQGMYAHAHVNPRGDGGERGRGHIRARWDAAQFDGRGGVVVDVGHQPFGNTWTIVGNWWQVFAVEVLLNGTGTVWTRNPERTVVRFGYQQSDRDALPGLGESQELYELRPQELDMGWFDISEEDALAIARAVVEENYNPKLVHHLRVVPNGPTGYRARPWHLGRAVQLPDGSIGRAVSWSYDEAHTPASSSSWVQLQVEVPNPLTGERARRHHYGRAKYRVSRYGGN